MTRPILNSRDEASLPEASIQKASPQSETHRGTGIGRVANRNTVPALIQLQKLELIGSALAAMTFNTSDDPRRNPWHATSGCELQKLRVTLKQMTLTSETLYLARADLVSEIEHACDRGLTLRGHLPHTAMHVQREWLGERWIWLHESQRSQCARWTSLVSSRLGRNGHKLPSWPRLVEQSLAEIARSGRILLHVPRTSTAALVEPFLACAAVPFVTVQIAKPIKRTKSCLADKATWLLDRLVSVKNIPPRDFDWTRVELSPAWNPADELESLPIQDRVAFCWGHWMKALHVRPGGSIDRLLMRRLTEPNFPVGTVSVNLSDSYDSRGSRGVRDTQRIDWLRRGGVGWYVPPHAHAASNRCECGAECDWHVSTLRAEPPIRFQWSSRLALLGSREGPTGELFAEKFLVHCVRSASGKPTPQRGLVSGLLTDVNVARRLLQDQITRDLTPQSSLPPDSPLQTLVEILETRRLRSSSGWARGGGRCVSFSAVPLGELLQRRTFQSHLGRWDWEPYGVMIRRDALEQLGARPVIYGTEFDASALPPSDLPYFQPAFRRRLTRGQWHWQSEREWRIFDDVRLKELPQDAIFAFVPDAVTAARIATRSNWPVIWLKDDRIAAPPTPEECRQCRAIRIGKN